ncbi:MAG: rod shape-determining protein MreD [Proteobacteria bacterium]|nr:rod shape-determining protein MreD [Pseudomonadota bacterium]
MAAPLTHYITLVARGVGPFALAALLVLLMRLPVQTDGLGWAMPHVTLAFVFYWIVHNQKAIPVLALFLLGLVEDFASGAPLGMNPMILIIVYVLLANQRRFFINRSFAVCWAGFAFIASAALAFSWLLESFYRGQPMPVGPLFLSLVVTIAAYPILGGIFGRYQQSVQRY